MSDRQTLRRRFRSLRRAIPQNIQKAHSAAVAHHFFAAGLGWRARTIGLYMANDGEIDLALLATRLRRARRQILLPVVRHVPAREAHLAFRQWDADTRMIPNRYGIPEPGPGAAFVDPIALDLLLMPLVAFDRHGTRLGMGAGFYDRFLGGLAPPLRPRLVGIAHELQRSPAALPAAPWDVPLDGILTERGWQPFDR